MRELEVTRSRGQGAGLEGSAMEVAKRKGHHALADALGKLEPGSSLLPLLA